MDIHNIDKHFPQAFYLNVNVHAIHPGLYPEFICTWTTYLPSNFLVICIEHQALWLKNLSTKQVNWFNENLVSMRGEG